MLVPPPPNVDGHPKKHFDSRTWHEALPPADCLIEGQSREGLLLCVCLEVLHRT